MSNQHKSQVTQQEILDYKKAVGQEPKLMSDEELEELDKEIQELEELSQEPLTKSSESFKDFLERI